MNKFFNILVASFFIFMSYNIYISGNFIVRNQSYIELGYLRIPISLLLLFIGFYYLKNYKKEILKEPESMYKICTKCEESYNSSDLKDDICPNCDIKTVNLEGYFDKKR